MSGIPVLFFDAVNKRLRLFFGMHRAEAGNKSGFFFDDFSLSAAVQVTSCIRHGVLYSFYLTFEVVMIN